uniref:Uncharacterized protein n=1 Tax=Isometrus maculatus TaxID=497827 RepID=A0A0U1SPH4_ISOMC|nr:hypothetical protein [Isometrus maculatus]
MHDSIPCFFLFLQNLNIYAPCFEHQFQINYEKFAPLPNIMI